MRITSAGNEKLLPIYNVENNEKKGVCLYLW